MISMDKLKNKDSLILKWQPFLKKMARRYTRKDQEIEDYIQQGNIGLLLAFDKWDPEKGSFMTFGEYAARDQMRQYSRINQRIVSTPVETFNNVKRIRDLKEAGITQQAIADRLKIKPIHVSMALNYEFGVHLEILTIPNYDDNVRENFIYIFERKIKKMSSVKKNIFRLLLKGFNQSEISRILDVPKTKISDEISEVRVHENALQ